MTLQKGDFILIDYVAKVKETNEVFDTTKEDVAKKEHLYKEGRIYEPKLVVVGEVGWVLKPIDEALTTFDISKPSTVEISPEKGFGQRDPQKIRRVPIKTTLRKRNKSSRRSTNRIPRKGRYCTFNRRWTSTFRL